MVIGDDAGAQNLMERHLGREGFAVEKAGDGASGLAMARRLQPDLITLDVMMPRTDGWAVPSALKAEPGMAAIPVIMVTIVDDKRMGFALGAADFFVKPIDWTRLMAVLREHAPVTRPSLALVVEDDATTRDLLRKALANQGWRVAEAENRRAALEQVDAEAPQVILLDLVLLEMDGFEFMEAMRHRPKYGGIPVVVITGRDVTEEERRRLDGQVLRIIQKGTLDFKALVSEIVRLLSAA